MSDQIYGIHAIERLLKQSPHLIYHIGVTEGRLNPRLQSLKQQAEQLGVKVNSLPKAQFAKIDGVHQGVMAEVSPQARFDESDLIGLVETNPQALILFLDEVQDPHNLGAILRSADATGVDAVVIPKNNAVGVNPTVRKVACGAADSVRLVVVTNLSRTMQHLQQAGLWLVGLAGETEQTLYQADFKGPVGLVMGAEGSGLRRLTREHCDQLVAIPMKGQVESLNVSVATGVALYEVLRQRLV
ncbi:23S rRNA (guanosine(2251)-2'-O)-methyltransferase RlmB [Thiomicrospira sp. R3]|uniref:23S rRNA (guanosine(2251)-2'-O)-methyltransferase RlmB n=1 Tax=Thiomicrospira sp. R3 TaxID=3035472 RepID=UPI00259AF9DF|nr:23S rRNA (guanosine(2251)-2'-O)-methyltransferase RlmB [Thiomicrospira sp. R3]WFE69053.1 23S rRNA (guanosine(2251)-2'-O)-methyltransferase RlmB [Thiomicrospira sp. R3]